jgi:Na+-translocating ferredoxin:NAD+ oxidoreductase RnfE subunit
MTRVELRIVLAIYVLVSVSLAYLLLAAFGYANADEFGVFIPQVGGFHVEIEPYHLDK